MMRVFRLALIMVFLCGSGVLAFAQQANGIDVLVDDVESQIKTYNEARGYDFKYDDYSKRDPMQNLLKSPLKPVQVKVSRDMGALYLTGIVYNEDAPIAFINDEVFKEGDLIGGRNIERIEKDRVILLDGGEESELLLEWN